MKLSFLLVFLLVACQQQPEIKKDVVSSPAASTDSFLEEKDESCADSEMTEDKLVEHAMKPAQANTGGALQGASDCVVE